MIAATSIAPYLGSPPATQKRHFNAIPMSSSTNDVCFDEFSAPVNLSVTVLPTSGVMLLEGFLQGRADDGRLAGDLNFQAALGHDWAWAGAREAQLQAVTLEQVRAAWHRLVRNDGFLVTTGGDFKRVATAPAAR